MSRLIFVPQYPTPMRYQEWWYTEFQNQFRKHYDEVITLGSNHNLGWIDGLGVGDFSPVQEAINFECSQIKEFMDMKLYKDDTIFVADLSFPGFFLNVCTHRQIYDNVFAFIHGTSLNTMDYFSPVRSGKSNIELGQANLCKKVFVASDYHKKKLAHHIGFEKIINIGALPINPILSERKPLKKLRKKNMVVSVSRDCPQKVDRVIEDRIEEELGIQIIRKNDFDDWNDYYEFLEESQILLVTTMEETYGYAAMEAASCLCTPMVPNRFSYPELFERDCRWEIATDLIEKIGSYRFSSNPFPYDFTPKNLPKQAAFFNTLVSHMKEEV